MEKRVFVLILCSMVSVLRAQPPLITYTCDGGSGTDLTTTITLPAALSAAELLSGVDSNSAACQYVIDASGRVLITFKYNNGNTPDECGITLAGATASDDVYDVTLTTSQCADPTPCLLNTDYKFEFTCDYENPKQEVRLGSAFSVSGSAPAGATFQDGEDIVLDVVEDDGASGLQTPTSPSLGDELFLRLTLTLDVTSAYQSFKVMDCSFDLPGSGVSIPFVDNECLNSGYSALFSGNTGFTPETPTASELISISAPFSAFVWPNSTDLMIQCTVELCESATCPQRDCTPPARRKRRSISKTDERKLFTLLRVATHNGTFSATQNSMHPNALSVCNNQAYIIGLATLGFALAMTFVLSIGMFLLFKRTKPENAKTAYANNGAC